jgi:diaminopimelate decarboxylase
MSLTKINTPSYILDKSVLDHNINNMKKAFEKYWSNLIISYSLKTNSLPWLINYLKENGVYAEVVSPDEYSLAKELGYDDSSIVLNGPYKNFNNVKSLLDNGGIVNVDSPHEVDWLCDNVDTNKWEVGLRVNFDLEGACPGETLMGDEPGRFGLNVENGTFSRAVEKLESFGINVVGLHLHNNTKTKSIFVFETLAQKACDIANDLNLNLKYIDIGGGFFGDKPGAPSYEMYAKSISSVLKETFDKKITKLILEPGTAMVASSFKYLCKVFDIKKHKDRRLIFSDGSFVHTDFQLNNRKYDYEIIKRKNENVVCEEEQIITGFTCMEKDRFLNVQPNSLAIDIGDYILLKNVGAYTLNFVPLFIEFLPSVYVKKDDDFFLVREKWTANEYLLKNNYKLNIS